MAVSNACFATTHWSVVLTAVEEDSPKAAGALSQLCQTYWYPLYVFIRQQGHRPEEAKDLTQDFFCRLLQKEYLRLADRDRGRFRSFLLTLVKRFLVNEWYKQQTIKRGGRECFVNFDEEMAEERYRLEPVDRMTGERIYERRWALTLLDQVMERLAQDAHARGKSDEFELMKVFLYGDKSPLSQADIAARLHTTVGAVKVAVHRLRQRYRDLLREEVANTVASPAEVEAELRYLLTVLSA